MNLRKLSREEWGVVSQEAHALVFKENRSTHLNTFDYALMVSDDSDTPVAYATIIEMDKYSAYMQHGGAFPAFAQSPKVARAYHLMIAYLKEHNIKISTRVLNTNLPMIKLALSAGLLINGIDFLCGEIFLNLSWLKEKEVE